MGWKHVELSFIRRSEEILDSEVNCFHRELIASKNCKNVACPLIELGTPFARGLVEALSLDLPDEVFSMDSKRRIGQIELAVEIIPVLIVMIFAPADESTSFRVLVHNHLLVLGSREIPLEEISSIPFVVAIVRAAKDNAYRR